MRCTQTASSDDPLSADTPYVDETRAALIVKDLRRVIREAKVDLGSGTSLSLSPSVPVALINEDTASGESVLAAVDWAQGVPEGTLGEPMRLFQRIWGSIFVKGYWSTVRGLRLNTRPECVPGGSRGPFLVLPMPVDGLSAILTGVGDHVAEPEREHDDGSNPKNVDGETDEASQEGDRKDCHHHDVRHLALTEQRVNASSLR